MEENFNKEDFKKQDSMGVVSQRAVSDQYDLEDDFFRKHTLGDDGRRIADMNIEGMPWYVNEISEEERIRRAMEPTLNARETRKMISSALAASLLVALVFIVGMALFLCFCLYVWFD